MGRETKILLGLLGGLSFAFCGALLAKLLIARPPEGAGVDVHADVVWNGPQEIVEPPAPGRPAVSAFSASSSAEPDAAAVPVGRRSYPIDLAVAEETGRTAKEPRIDERVVPASLQTVAEPARAARPVVAGTSLILEPGDTWWSIAEAAYGDGRFHRALYAWNRAIDPTVAAAPGRRIDLPSRGQLQSAHAGLVPSPQP